MAIETADEYIVEGIWNALDIFIFYTIKTIDYGDSWIFQMQISRKQFLLFGIDTLSASRSCSAGENFAAVIQNWQPFKSAVRVTFHVE